MTFQILRCCDKCGLLVYLSYFLSGKQELGEKVVMDESVELRKRLSTSYIVFYPVARTLFVTQAINLFSTNCDPLISI